MKGLKYAFQQAGDVHKLYIYDDVTATGEFNWDTWSYDQSETSANYFREQLDQIPDDHKIELYINSFGGEVKEGVAIYNQLIRHKAHKTGYVDCYAYSVASLILQACDRRIMGAGSSMLIHEMWTYAVGNSKQLRKEADDLAVLMEANRKIYLNRAKNLTEDELIDMMEKETYLTPDQCMEYGFCDEVAERQDTTQSAQELAGKQLLQMQRAAYSQSHLESDVSAFLNGVMKQRPQPAAGPEEKKEPEDQKDHSGARKLMNAFVMAFSNQEDKLC